MEIFLIEAQIFRFSQKWASNNLSTFLLETSMFFGYTLANKITGDSYFSSEEHTPNWTWNVDFNVSYDDNETYKVYVYE